MMADRDRRSMAKLHFGVKHKDVYASLIFLTQRIAAAQQRFESFPGFG
jgi:hypothetical protein